MSDPVGRSREGTGKSGAGKYDQAEQHTPHCKETPSFLNRHETPTPLVSIGGRGLINIS
jgi:hypothetical protein